MAEVNNEKLHIRLHVYDEEIEVTVKRSDEEYYRKAAKLITDRYNAYAQAYKGKKGEHTIALMTLIDIALMYEREHGKNDTAPYQDILAKLTSEIEEALRSENVLTISIFSGFNFCTIDCCRRPCIRRSLRISCFPLCSERKIQGDDRYCRKAG